MAINYNEDGLFLGYFETLGSLMAQYNGRRGNVAVVGAQVWAHNGQRWIPTMGESEEVTEAIANVNERLSNAEEILQSLSVSGVEILWSYQSTIDETSAKPEGWQNEPLTPTEDNPICYVSSRFKTEGGIWSVWSAPSVFSRYLTIPELPQISGYSYIYYLSDKDNISQSLYADLLRTLTDENFGYDDFVPGNWYATIPEPTKEYPFVYVSSRKYVDGRWQRWSFPIIGYRYTKDGEDGKDGADGKDGEVDYNVVQEYFKEIITTDEQFTSLYTRIDKLEDSQGNFVTEDVYQTFVSQTAEGFTSISSRLETDYVTTTTLESEISQTAENIKLEVKNDLQTAGLDITSGKVVIYGDKVLILPNKDSETPTALFDSDGYLNANLIRSKAQYFYDEDGNLRSTINRNYRGEYVIYYLPEDDDEKANPKKQIEIGYDENTLSIIRMYDRDGLLLRWLGFDLERKEAIVIPEDGKWSTIDLVSLGTTKPIRVQEEYTNSTKYHQFTTDAGIVLCNTQDRNDLANDGWYTAPGKSIVDQVNSTRTKIFFYYKGGVLINTESITYEY